MGKFYEGLCEELILYVRFAAWLNTAPTVEQKKSISKAAVRTPTRLEKLRADKNEPDYQPDMPEAAALHLLGYLWDAGPSMSGGMGPVPLTHSELVAWQQNSGIELTPWEAQTLRRLSIEHINECVRADKPDCPSPLAVVMTDEDREAVSNKVQRAFKMLIETRPKP